MGGRNLNFKYLSSREECEMLLERDGDYYGPSWHPIDMNLSSIHSTKYMHVLEPLQRPADYMFPEGFGTTFPVGPRDKEFQELALAREKAALKYPGSFFLTDNNEDEDIKEEGIGDSGDGLEVNAFTKHDLHQGNITKRESENKSSQTGWH